MDKSKILYHLKTTMIYSMLIGTPVVAYSQNKSIWDKINSTPMSEKLAIAQKNYDKTHFSNMSYTKNVSKRYIQQIIEDSELEDFMLNCILTNGSDYYSDLTPIIKPNADKMIFTIKSRYKWFDDLMKYLSGKINDEDFYATGFFNTIHQYAGPFCSTLYDMKRWRGFIERNSNSR